MSRAITRSLLACLPLLVLGCPKDAPPATADAAAAPPVDAGATAMSDAGAKRAAADSGAGYTRADRDAFLKPLDAGRKKARAKDWVGALADFDKALAIAPNDARVLSEVGWAAFNANDLPRAENANRHALALTKQPVLRAQILYNTGRVAEAKKDQAAARQAYAESLSLRDNAEVKKRLAAVGGPPDSNLPCAAGAASIEELCACLLKGDTIYVPEWSKKVCAVDPVSLTLGTPRVAVVRAGAEESGERLYLLAARDGAALRPVAEVGRDYEPGAFGIHNEATVTGGILKIVGARTVSIVKSEQNNVDTNMAGLELCTDDEKLETVCSITTDKKPMRCVTVPVSISAGCGAGVDVDSADLDPEMKETITSMKAGWHHSDVKLTWTITDTGALVVAPPVGDAALVPAGMVGTHQLF